MHMGQIVWPPQICKFWSLETSKITFGGICGKIKFCRFFGSFGQLLAFGGRKCKFWSLAFGAKQIFGGCFAVFVVFCSFWHFWLSQNKSVGHGRPPNEFWGH